jgi:hypothetical protein
MPLGALPIAGGSDRLKRLALRRFPFDVIVALSRDDIVVVAFAHHARRPGYWRDRRTT